jgi:hypothetical protein
MDGADVLRRSVRETRAPDRYEEEVFCICRKGYRVGDFMIACDECDEWYHGACVGFEEDVRSPRPETLRPIGSDASHPFLFAAAAFRRHELPVTRRRVPKSCYLAVSFGLPSCSGVPWTD